MGASAEFTVQKPTSKAKKNDGVLRFRQSSLSRFAGKIMKDRRAFRAAALLVLGGFLVVPGDCFAFSPGSLQRGSSIQNGRIQHGSLMSPAFCRAAAVHPRIHSKRRATIASTNMMMDPASLNIGMKHEKKVHQAGGATAILILPFHKVHMTCH